MHGLAPFFFSFFCQRCQMAFHNSHAVNVCVVRELAASIKQGAIKQLTPASPHACIHLLAYILHAYTFFLHTYSQWTVSVTASLSPLSWSFWEASSTSDEPTLDRVLALACLTTGITYQQCCMQCNVCVRACVYVSWNSLSFLLIPFQAAGGKQWQIYWSTLDLKAICHGIG